MVHCIVDKTGPGEDKPMTHWSVSTGLCTSSTTREDDGRAWNKTKESTVDPHRPERLHHYRLSSLHRSGHLAD
uniref:Uncharacterized protein n=1 Tax=Oryza barthii TaxID=65489 RepID=A0A0D3FAU4_9ORYZ